MASAAVAFTVDPLASQDAASFELNLRLESKRAADSDWQRVSEQPVALKDVHVINQLNRAHFAYRLSLRAATSDAAQSVAFPFYLTAPALASTSSSNDDSNTCPPQIGTFAITQMSEQLQCKVAELEVTDSTSASEAAAMLGGTLAVALLVYSLLPYVRARNRKRRRSRSQSSRERLRSCSDEQDFPSTPTTPNGASRRMWGGFDDDGIEPAGAYRDGSRERKGRQPEANGSVVSDTGSELLLAKLPDFNDERGWRDFFDSEIYRSEPQEQKRAATNTFSSVKGRRDSAGRESFATKRLKLRQTKMSTTTATTVGGDRYRTIRDRIDRAATEAAIDDAQSFYEFWQM
ncbi:uncharacterized protein KRP23_14500 [Phytophthora ramorum]|uniref:uncharacterized protein n=1 Tax=Phytophthora ramorum TaxID=164328 RepID=UPI0030A4AF84|nr:hypothetical protein KRP23_14500 [Phytophthora ramorum]